MHTAQRTLCKHAACFSHPKHTVRPAKTATPYKQSSNSSVSRLRTYRPYRSVLASSSRGGSLPVVTQPRSPNDVDRDLWAVLDLASDEELEGVHDMLFGEQLSQILSLNKAADIVALNHLHELGRLQYLFNGPIFAVETNLLSPLIKSVLTAREPAALKHRGRAAVMHRIEQRMRFLGVSLRPLYAELTAVLMSTAGIDTQADSASTLRGHYPSYREMLLKLCHKLDIKCPRTLITEVGQVAGSCIDMLGAQTSFLLLAGIYSS